MSLPRILQPAQEGYVPDEETNKKRESGYCIFLAKIKAKAFTNG